MKRLSWDSITKVQTFCRNDPPAQLLTWKLSHSTPLEPPALNDIVKLASIRLNKSFLVGQILVKNLSFKKSIIVRYTTDAWASYRETTATYTVKSFNGFDSFSFTIDLDAFLLESRRPMSSEIMLSFCIKYCVNACEYWDNNNGKNHNIELIPPIARSVSPSLSIPTLSQRIPPTSPKPVPNSKQYRFESWGGATASNPSIHATTARRVAMNSTSDYWSGANKASTASSTTSSYTSRMKFYDHSRNRPAIDLAIPSSAKNIPAIADATSPSFDFKPQPKFTPRIPRNYT